MGFTALPLASGGVRGAAYAISADGHVAVGSVSQAGTPTSRVACYWTDAAGPTVIGTSFSEAFGASSDGSVIAGYNQGGTLWRWTAAGGRVNFGTTNDTVYGMSADASRAIGSRLTGSPLREQAAVWNAAGTVTLLGYLAGHNVSRAQGVSADGSVIVGYSQLAGSSNTQRAFRWTAGGGMVDLGITGAATASRAFGVSGDGSEVVGGLTASPNTAFRWTAAGGMVAIPALIIATGISGDGGTIIASSFLPDFSDSYLGYMTTIGITVPTPVALDPAQPGVIQGTYPTGVAADGMTMAGYSFGTNPLPWLYTVAPPEPPGQKPKLWLLRQPEFHFIGTTP